MAKIKEVVPEKKPKVKKLIKMKVKKSSKDNKEINIIKINKVASSDSTNKVDTPKIKITEKQQKFIMPSQFITEVIVNSSLDALEKMAKHYKQKNKMFEEETAVFAEINCIKIQHLKGKVTFVLPHSTVASTGEVCLITPDLKKGRKVDHEPTVDHWEELLRKSNVTSVKTVMPMRQLRVEYDQYELKRRLLTQHDYILVDTRVLNHVSHILGKFFFKKHNMLIPVRINENNLKKCIDIGLKTAILRLSEGATSTVLIGHMGMTKKALKENILSLVEQLKEKFPGGEANIRTISIKLPLSLSLPLYITLRPSNTLPVPKIHHTRPKLGKDVEGELSTIPGATVKVSADGTVHVLRNKANDGGDSDMEAIDDDLPDEIDDNEQSD